eukprot:6194766-Pleurochrysis_carterae.AAC.1
MGLLRFLIRGYRQYEATSQQMRSAQERDSDLKRRVASLTIVVIPRQPHGLARREAESPRPK